MSADATNRETLTDCWSRDAKHVYSVGRRIRNADRDSFTVLNEHYAVDRNRVYTPKGPVNVAHLPSFRVVGPAFHWFNVSNAYAADQSNVYYTEFLYKARVVKTADPANFEALSHGYGADDKTVYWGWKRLSGASPNDWQFKAGPHSTSDQKAYCFAKRIKGADGHSLTSLPILQSNEYWCRADAEYYLGDTSANAQDYFAQFADCFIFIGRVADFVLSDRRGDNIPLDTVDRWAIAKHAWIDVAVSTWLQKPSINLAEPLINGRPIRFGEAMNFHHLSDESWINEDRVWILRPDQHHSYVEEHLYLARTECWWESSRITNLDLISDLIDLSNAT